MDTVTEVAETDFKLAFDPTLVRGMSYYTGTIFEVSMEELRRFRGRRRPL
jgi:histidyl-tRNA synthetase